MTIAASGRPSSGNAAFAVATCPAGTLAIGGGYVAIADGTAVAATDLLVQRATPLDDFSGYRVDGYRATPTWTLYVTALCVNAIQL